MPSLKDFVEALQAGWFPALAALVGCAIVITGDWLKLPYLDSTPEWLLTTAVVVGVFAFSVLAANIAYLPVLLFKRLERARRREKFLDTVRATVRDAPADEITLLAYLVTTGRKAFAAEFNDRRLAPLVSKGIIKRLGGTHSMLEWPFMVQDDAWQYLLENKEQLTLHDADQMPDPFHWRNNF